MKEVLIVNEIFQATESFLDVNVGYRKKIGEKVSQMNLTEASWMIMETQ